VPAAFDPESPFRTVVPVRRLPLSPVVSSVRDSYLDRFGSEPADRGGWYSRHDWLRISFVLGSLRPGGRFLDVGLGAGQFINAVAASGHFDEVHGSDPVRFAKYVELSPGIARSDASVAELPFPDDHFDVVTCMEVLEHIPEEIFDAALSELRRVCRGQLITTVPYEEPEPIYSGHRRRFESADIVGIFPAAERVLLERPGMSWAVMEEWPSGPAAVGSPLRLAAVEACLDTQRRYSERPETLTARLRRSRFARMVAPLVRRLRRLLNRS
jgi:SAM-dependent methyltransferase